MAETTTKERPINLKAWEVKALMDGRLTQLRRRIKPHGDYLGSGGKANREEWDDPKCWGWEDPEDPGSFIVLSRDPDSGDKSSKCPYGKPGERLWVRETWADVNTENGPAIMYRSGELHFCVDDAYPVEYERYPGMNFSMWCGDLARGEEGHSWRRSTDMPRWASRITLEITGLAVGRIQDITEKEAELASGHETGIVRDGQAYDHFERKWCSYTKKADPNAGAVTMRGAFAMQWDHDNGAGAWDRNEWAWVIGVRRLEVIRGQER